MGKGNGEHPPQKFVNDQCFCQLCIFVFMGASFTLASLSAGMDDGGSFPVPYFISGFVLAFILLANLLSRWCVVKAVYKKGLTRKNIIDTLSDTKWGKHIWPWSCRVGMLWCLAGSILTGLGGVNCGKGTKDNAGNSTVSNTCYYNIEGELGDLYKGLAIALVVMHAVSFVYLLLSHCPVDGVIDQVKEDPRRNTVNPANNRPAATRTAPPAATPSAPAAANTTQASSTGGRGNEIEIRTKIQTLESRVKELENREREIRELNVLSPPPSYNEPADYSSHQNTGAHPDNSFP